MPKRILGVNLKAQAGLVHSIVIDPPTIAPNIMRQKHPCLPAKLSQIMAKTIPPDAFQPNSRHRTIPMEVRMAAILSRSSCGLVGRKGMSRFFLRMKTKLQAKVIIMEKKTNCTGWIFSCLAIDKLMQRRMGPSSKSDTGEKSISGQSANSLYQYSCLSKFSYFFSYKSRYSIRFLAWANLRSIAFSNRAKTELFAGQSLGLVCATGWLRLVWKAPRKARVSSSKENPTFFQCFIIYFTQPQSQNYSEPLPTPFSHTPQPQPHKQPPSSLFLHYNQKQLLMLVTKQVGRQKRKRLSQSRNGERKTGVSGKKVLHNRSSSMQRDKKELRFNTDYADYDQVYTTSIANYTKFQKKLHPARRRDTFDCEGAESLPKQIIVQSTKYNPNKNVEIKALFRPSKDEPKVKAAKNRPNNHPFLKFLGKKSIREKMESPYNRPAQRQPSQHSQQSHNSISGTKQRTSNSKKPQLIINKDHINIKQEVGSREQHNIKEQLTQKVDLDKSKEKEKEKSRGRREEQWTVKTIKRPANEQLNESVSSNQSYGLTEEEESTFGDRFPYGFEKIKLLGRGGFSLVWLGKHIKSGREFAIKQIITQNTHQTHIKQIWFGTMFFSLGGVPKPEYTSFPGVKNLVRLYSYEINQTDTWIFYEKCGLSLGSALYDIRSQKIYGEQKLYKIHYKPLYQAFAANPKLLSSLVLQICRALALLSECEIVHSDLKTENILLKVDKQGKDCEIRDVKLIDYGSSFEFRNIAQFSMATPEYMPPEILNYIIHQNQGKYEEQLYEKVMTDYRHPWTVDIWSLGCVLLEIIVGVPLWMSLPLLVPGKQGGYLQKQGLFAVKGRLFPEIIAKQRSINPHIDQILDKDNYSKIVVSPTMRRIIKGMLDIDFNRRISPQQVISLLQNEPQ